MNSIKTYSLTQDEKIIFAYVYGSFVDQEMPFFKDIEVGIYIKNYKEEDWQKYELTLPYEIERILQFRFPVDVKVLNDKNVIFSYNVIRGSFSLQRMKTSGQTM